MVLYCIVLYCTVPHRTHPSIPLPCSNPAPAVGGSWPEFSAPDERFLALSPAPRVERSLLHKRVALWLDLLPALINATRPAPTRPAPGPGDWTLSDPVRPSLTAHDAWPFAWPNKPPRRDDHAPFWAKLFD